MTILNQIVHDLCPTFHGPFAVNCSTALVLEVTNNDLRPGPEI